MVLAQDYLQQPSIARPYLEMTLDYRPISLSLPTRIQCLSCSIPPSVLGTSASYRWLKPHYPFHQKFQEHVLP